MLNVRLIAVGKLRERYLAEGCAEYQKRLGAFCRLELVELPEARLAEKPSEAQIEAALSKEAEQVLERAKGSYLIALCVEGRAMPSKALSERLSKLAVDGISAVSFVIGSSFGLSPRVKAAADLCLSMSEMTFPHQLMRLMLLEQLYRAFSITVGGKYHK